MQLVEPRPTILALGLAALPVFRVGFPFFYQVCSGIQVARRDLQFLIRLKLAACREPQLNLLGDNHLFQIDLAAVWKNLLDLRFQGFALFFDDFEWGCYLGLVMLWLKAQSWRVNLVRNHLGYLLVFGKNVFDQEVSHNVHVERETVGPRIHRLLDLH